jgi:hypothetical protein
MENRHALKLVAFALTPAAILLIVLAVDVGLAIWGLT